MVVDELNWIISIFNRTVVGMGASVGSVSVCNTSDMVWEVGVGSSGY